MKCSAEDSTVAIALTTENGQARAGVADRGRGIGDADSAGLSSRFRRGSNVVDVVGSGLVCLSAPALAFDIEDRIRTGQKVPQAMLSILSTTDIPAAEPLLRLSAGTPGAGGGLCGRLGDGFAHAQGEVAGVALPHWAHWRDLVFGFALGPVVIVATASAFDPSHPAKTRCELIDALRDDPERFRGKLGTHDPAASEVGYLFATQDASFVNTF